MHKSAMKFCAIKPNFNKKTGVLCKLYKKLADFYDFLAKITGSRPQLYTCTVGFSAKCTISGKNPVESLLILPIDKFCNLWYNGNLGLTCGQRPDPISYPRSRISK